MASSCGTATCYRPRVKPTCLSGLSGSSRRQTISNAPEKNQTLLQDGFKLVAVCFSRGKPRLDMQMSDFGPPCQASASSFASGSFGALPLRLVGRALPALPGALPGPKTGPNAPGLRRRPEDALVAVAWGALTIFGTLTTVEIFPRHVQDCTSN